jgi:DNA end-binding protein Ku
MPQAVWTGALSFGLVSVPVRLVPATEAKDVRFHLYDREGRRVRYRRVVEARDAEPSSSPTPPSASGAQRGPDDAEAAGAAATAAAATSEAAAPSRPSVPPERTVDWGDVRRGRETDAGDLVLLTDEEIDRVRPRRSGTIDVEAFVELGDIDPVHFEKTYYAVPRSAADGKPYALLHRAMRRAERVGIGRFVLRTKPHLVAVRAMEELLAVHTLFFGDEVRDPRAVSPPLDVRVSSRELDLAEQLIEMLRVDWNPADYADTYREELLRLLAEKEPVARAEAEATGAAGPRIDELMTALRESVEEAKRARTSRSTRKRGTRAG